jgi:hypothetical protein
MVRTESYVGSLAMQVADPRPKDELATFMKAFGHSNRRTVSRPPIASPLQPIIMMQSPVVGERVAGQNNRVAKLLKTETNDKVVEEMFLAALSRVPTPAEKDLALTAMGKDRVRGAQNLQWALLNLAEFLYNF